MNLFSLWRQRPRPTPRRRRGLSFEALEDRLQPATIAAPDLLTQCDTGSSAFDNLTNNNQPVFAGTTTSPAGTSIALIIDDAVVGTYSVANGGGGTFTLQPNASLADGNHIARFRDSATHFLSAALAFTIDTTAPETPTVPIIGPIGDPANVAVTIQGGVGDLLHVGVGGQEALALIATGVPQTISIDVTGLSLDPTKPLVVTAFAEDAAGNGSASTSASASLTGPAPPADLHLTAASDTGILATDGITSATTLTFTGTAVAGQIVTLYIDGSAATTQPASADGSFEISAGPLAEGAHQAWVTVRVAGGAAGEASTPINLTIDRTPPVISAASLAPDHLSPNGDGVQDVGAFHFTLSEDAYVAVHFLDSDGFDLGAIPLDIVPAGDQEFDLDVPQFGEGTYTIVLVASDLADNVGAMVDVPFTVDVTPPSAPTFGLAPSQDDGISTTDRVTTHTAPTFAGMSEAGAAIELREGGNVVGTATAAADGSWSITATLGVGAHSLIATSTDQAGNSSASLAQSFVVDPNAPTAPLDLAPVLSLPATASAYRNSDVTFGSALHISDADSANVLVLIGVDQGTVILPSTAGLIFASGSQTSLVTIQGSIAAVNSALASLVVRPNAGYLGTVNVAVQVDDLAIGAPNGAQHADGACAIAVANRPPTIVATPAFSMNANATLTAASSSIASAFTDPDGDSLTYSLVRAPEKGSMTFNADGSFIYKPPVGFVGTVTFVVEAFDGVDFSSPLTVTITVKSAGGLRR